MSSCTHKHSFFMLIFGGMLAVLSFTNDSVASEGEVSCSMPIGVYNSDLLEQVEERHDELCQSLTVLTLSEKKRMVMLPNLFMVWKYLSLAGESRDQT